MQHSRAKLTTDSNIEEVTKNVVLLKPSGTIFNVIILFIQFNNGDFTGIEIDGLMSDESLVYMCKSGMRLVGIENCDKGEFNRYR